MRARRHPDWLKVKRNTGNSYDTVHNLLKTTGLCTVCHAAKCPNRGECYGNGTATFMILGDTCTRNCLYCNVRHGNPEPPDPDEPVKVAEAVRVLGLRYVVVTSVTRDDLEDFGAGHFHDTIIEINRLNPGARVEVLTPDFQGSSQSLEKVLSAGPYVFNHNLEVVRELYPHARPRGDFDTALKVLKSAKSHYPGMITKSGLMAGLGETREQLLDAFRELQKSRVDVLTLGQYLQPRRDLLPVARYYPPEEFDELRDIALSMGFRKVFAGPLVRSSYLAEEVCG
ncbi:MAG: lipoyl synthase [Candidatus Latescibacterota bacterium]